MKAIVLTELTAPNPAFNRREARAAKRRGEKYPIPRTVTLQPGDEIDHPDVHIHCCTSPPKCRPSDAECTQAVHRFFNSPKRKARLLQLKQMAAPAVLKTLPKELQEYVAMALPKYADELQQLEQPADVINSAGDTIPPLGTPFPVDGDELTDFVDDEDTDEDVDPADGDE